MCMCAVSYDALSKSDVYPEHKGPDRELWLRRKDSGTHAGILQGLSRSGCFEGGYFNADKLLHLLITGTRYTGARMHKHCLSSINTQTLNRTPTLSATQPPCTTTGPCPLKAWAR